jgi:glycosyltransferase involved in cell wall biosynthesis
VTAAAVVYNGRSAQAFPAAGKRPFIFSAGRIWDEAKNIGLLDHIAPELAWPVYVAGSQAGARAKLRHLPSLGQLSPSRLRSTLGEAAIYAAPAFYEPFGLAILEAALSGCTLVLADIPTLRELWDGAAVFVSPRDPQAWIPALNGLVRDQAQRERLGQLAYERARLYSLERMVQGYDDLYAALLRTSDAGVAA